mmetsp:Transcript_29291/g.45306  ORF Transcript_29291/g.45306 Transcript_29291/m.45306 type:complete len:324 (-) Transcript_29291:659-1630(-)
MKTNHTKPLLPSIWTFRHLGTINTSTLTKVILKITPSGTPGEIADIQLTSLFRRGTGHEISTGATVVVVAVSKVVVVVIATSTASSTIVVSKSTTTTATTSRGGFTILTNKDWTTIQFRILEFTNGTLGFFGALVDDYSAAFGSTVVALENVSLVNVSNPAHMILQLLPSSLIRKVTNINVHVTQLVVVSSTTTSCTTTNTIQSTTMLSTMTMLPMMSTTRNLLLPILPHKNLPPTQFRIIQSINRILRSLLIGKLHNSTSFGTSIIHHHHFGKLYLTCITHMIFQILPCHLIGQITNINTFGTGIRRLFRLTIFPHKNLPTH